MKGVLKYFIAIFSMLLFFSCKKNNDANIPLVNVDITIYINNPEHIDLQSVGGWEYLNGGSRGLIIYRSGTNSFKAYDRHCPYQPSNSCGLVSVDANNIQASDACCGSKFLLNNGSVTSGPANTGLKTYQTSFDGNALRIYN
ncbi:MAG: hypothetical protein Kow0079_03080 [Vicingaceae bacterium]